MYKTLLPFATFILCITSLDGETYYDRPKITTSDGNLIISPGNNKNIYLRSNGPNSKVFINGVNLLNITTTPRAAASATPEETVDIRSYLDGRDGILQRLERLETNSAAINDVTTNISLLWTRVNRLTRSVNNLRRQLPRRTEDCTSSPCQHGGTCLDVLNGYHCLCPNNWEGTNCEVDVNECRNFFGTDLGCQNGATCLNLPGTYQCSCRSGWYGTHCNRKEKDCSGGDFEMCGHGSCISVTTGQGIKCICNQGWTTNGTDIACLTDVNECDSSQGARCSVNPKVNCINLPGSFRCGQCPAGYEGDGYVCSDIDECLTLPNGGCSMNPIVSCQNTIGSRICGPCPAGFQGDGVTCTWRGSCNIDHGGCHPSAQCIDTPSLNGQTTQCICPQDMEGDGVGLQGCYVPFNRTSLTCGNNPCGFNGRCHSLNSGYSCICYRGFTGAHCTAPVNYCSSSPCRNGGECRPDAIAVRGFRCECPAMYSGDLCQVTNKVCGGVVDAQEGNIAYPSSNTTYSHNSKCAWVIRTVSDKVLNVTFSRFNLEEDPECLYDFLQIHDGRSPASQLLGRFCGNEFPKGGHILSTHNYLYMWFRSDQSIAKAGFALHWNSIDPVCGGEINATVHGQISSPGSPSNYPANRDCYWHLVTNYGKRIQLHFFELDIEVHSNCSYDYLAIYDGATVSDPLLNKYCDSTLPAPFHSSGSEILIHFHSDAFGAGKGFQISYAPTEGVPGCGGMFTHDKGEISPPTYQGKYLGNLLCEYKIVTEPDTKIKITFSSFKVEFKNNCDFDYLKVYDGPSSDYPLYGKFCGSTVPPPFTSSSNKLFIKFKSDESLSSDGFRIRYETVCHHELYGDSGIITSPGYPLAYPANKKCEYVIKTTPGKIIKLKFQDFSVENSIYYNCNYDKVEVRDGIDIAAPLLGRFCGSVNIPVQISSYNFMHIFFQSDMSVSGAGFYANFTTEATECGGIYRELDGNISFPQNGGHYNRDQNCIWMIMAPEGSHIQVTWNRFQLERSSTCFDYVDLYEVDALGNEVLLGKYCGFVSPPALTTYTNRLKINFVSDSAIQYGGFSFTYSTVNDKNNCGARFLRTNGIILSPGWPKNYQANKDCVWTIQVPNGQQIRLNISQFDLERPIYGSCDNGDYLEIRNGQSENSTLLNKLCGRFSSKRVTSLSNTLFIRFHSDAYLGGKGFKIEWDGTVTGCGGVITGATGTLASPNYPLSYSENAECMYKIITSHGSRVQISFTELQLESFAECDFDYVQVFDGRDDNAPEMGKYCDVSHYKGPLVTSTNYAYIKFKSDMSITGKGFLLNYATICNNNLTGSYGVIESLGFPGPIPERSDCLWTITVPKGNKIGITFTHFNIFKSRSYQYYSQIVPTDSCRIDFLQMKETSAINFSTKFCGSTIPAPVNSTTNSFQIKLVTRYILNQGFRLEWVRLGCGGYLQKKSGILSLSRNLVTSGELECEWVIETPIGTRVTLEFTDVYMSDTKNCTVDAIEVYNGPNSQSPMLTKVCHRGSTRVEATSNYMFVKFVKNSSLRDVNFASQFSSSMSTCGGRIESRSGVIHSKNYPKNYDNSVDCIWYIKVPINHRIELNIIDLDLYNEDDDDCKDAVKIYDGLIRNINYTHLICPKSEVKQIISKQNQVAVQFTTDFSGTAKGFKMNFTMICGAIIQATASGIVTNDNFVRHSNVSCVWTILAPNLSDKLVLTITHMSIPKDNIIITNRDCPSTFLRIFEGDNTNGSIVGEYCGNKVPHAIVSHGSALTIELGTYSNSVKGKFSAHYSSLSTACGGTLTSEEGTVASPNYPQSYPPGVDCEWTLTASPGNLLHLTFEDLGIEYSERCNEDYLEIREKDGAGKLIGIYCDDVLPTNLTTASNIYVKFHSNSQSYGDGFIFHFGYLHFNEITGARGQISSPLFPNSYIGAAEYTWRIFSERQMTISLTVNRVVMHNLGDTCRNNLIIYDGYNDEAPVINIFCGLETKTIISTSNVVYIKLSLGESNDGSLFNLSWSQVDTKPEEVVSGINCGLNQTVFLLPGIQTVVKSPKHPEKYDNDLNCQWKYETQAGYHLVFTLERMSLEETSSCFADYISIYSSNSPMDWKPVAENICLSENKGKKFNATTNMKIEFKTDSSISRTGFKGTVRASCGGFMDSASGIISVDRRDFSYYLGSSVQCDWVVKVRPGRHIKINFEQLNITHGDNTCNIYVMLRNGGTPEAPMLSDGKYCGLPHENRHELKTSTNYLHVSFTALNANYAATTETKFKLRYEEQDVHCGLRSQLDVDHTWETITTPNYPSIPLPYSECVWVFTGPPGEILRIDFIDRFDIKNTADCSLEYIEIRDGTSSISPVKATLCGDKPGTVKTTSNSVYIKYITRLQEPNNGFKANVSIDVCGGTIYADSGEVTSPGYPHWPNLPQGTVCEYSIIGKQYNVFTVTLQDLLLPEPETVCATKLTIESIIPLNDTMSVLETFCDEEGPLEPINTYSSRLIVKLHVGKRSEWVTSSESRGFRLTFNTSRQACGGSISDYEGIITSPGYPRESILMYCQWTITIPDPTKRVTIELLDFDLNKYTISIFNDFSFQSAIQVLRKENSTNQRIFKSSGNKMSMYFFTRTVNRFRFKAKFSSEEAAVCGGFLHGTTGTIANPDEASYNCEWNYENTDTTMSDYKSMLVTVNVNTTVKDHFRRVCRYGVPTVELKANVNAEHYLTYFRSVCAEKEISYRVPSSSMIFRAFKNKMSYMDFTITWKLQPCGGVVHVGQEFINILNVTASQNYTIDCAWIIRVPAGKRLELKLQGSFVLGCTDEYVKIDQGIYMTSPTIAEYCKDKTQQNSLITFYKSLMIQYHSGPKTDMNIRLEGRVIDNECGGESSMYDPEIMSPNFPHSYSPNQECVWEIKADLGNRISLRFIERFDIEDRENCTKDALIIYDWSDNKYNEIARLCNRTIPPVFNSTSNRMKLIFRTDAQTNHDGFKAIWVPLCGGDFVATEKEQFLYSPRFPGYPPLKDCHFKIKSLNDQRMILKFEEFQLEGSYPDCTFDNLTITDDSNGFFSTYCEAATPADIVSSGTIDLHFKSDKYIGRKGFKAMYKLYTCGGTIKDPTVLTSGPGSNYESNMNCTWNIEAPTGKVVVMKLVSFNLENNEFCENDYVAVYEGTKIDDSKRMALLCGKLNKNIVLKSSGNAMVVNFRSDYSLNTEGFKADVYFSYAESAGCGGTINITSASPYSFKSPLIGNNSVYDNYLDCHWIVTAPVNYVVKIAFKTFHISPCSDVNQTAIGYSNCDCDLVEIKDGPNPESYVVGSYCGHTIPPLLSTSSNIMSVRLYTDGDINSAGFEALVTAELSPCGRTTVKVTNEVQTIKTPGYDTGVIPRGLHCNYHILADESYLKVHIKIKQLDLEAPESARNRCYKDRLTILSNNIKNTTLGRDYILNKGTDMFLSHSILYDYVDRMTDHYEICGRKESTDFFVYGGATLNLQTSAESSDGPHRGIEMEVSISGICSQNYTSLQGRISSTYSFQTTLDTTDCFILITVPENYTISAYFFSAFPPSWSDSVYLSIFDGNTTNSGLLQKIQSDFVETAAAFSTGRYMLLQNHGVANDVVIFDLNYVATDKGIGCGGKLHNAVGRIMSPKYPDTHRQVSTCEWELETPQGTHLLLHFLVFDLRNGATCATNYLELVRRNGDVVSRFCSESPADFTSTDNYVKVVFKTDMNNGGAGWIADFVAIEP